MKKNNLTLKETFELAVGSYQKKDFDTTQALCSKILSINPDHLSSLVMLANVAALNKNFKKANEFLTKANEIEPNNLGILNNLGTTFKELGELKKAINIYEKIIKINPKHTNSNYNLGVVFYKLKDFKKAKNFFQKTTEVQPNYGQAFISLANINVELKEYDQAIRNYQKAIEINPQLVSAHNNLGLVFRLLDDYKNAIDSYKKAIAINSNHPSAHHNLALAFKEMGRFEEAKKSHENAIKSEPENLINYFYLNELKKNILDSNLKDKIIKVIKNNNTSERNLAYGNYLLSKYEKKSKNYEKEIEYLKQGHKYFFNSKKEKFDLGIKYCFDDLIKISEGASVQNLNKNDNYEIKPIFIIGVPRCGSTLVEKIIASGKQLVPTGEETTVFENFINAKILEKQSLNLGEVKEVRTQLSKIYKNKGLILEKYNYSFTDKSLNNFFYLGLIKDIYPNAKIINCKRNYLSSIMSIFQNNITELAWAHDLNSIFKYFNNYVEIIESYKEVYPNNIYELEFEKLVNNSEEETKKLMKYCELPWDKKCLEFYKREDLISKTASNVQVRQAIYKHSAEKYLPYKKLLNEHGKTYPWFN